MGTAKPSICAARRRCVPSWVCATWSSHHSAATIDHACKRAVAAGTYRFKDIRRLIGENAVQTSFAFAEKHPLIRDLGTYSEFVRNATD